MAPRKRSRGNAARDQATSPLPTEVTQPSEYGQSDNGKTISELAASDKEGRIAKYRRWINQALEVQEPFQRAYIESMKILANDVEGHWTAAGLAELGKRPPLVINHTTSTVMTVWGLQRRTRQIAKFLPGDPDDADAVELLEYLYRWHYEQLGLKETDSQVFLKKYAGGIGFWKFSYDTSEDPRGRLAVEEINPLNVLWDPNYPDAKWNDAMYVVHAEWRTIDEAIDEWPEHEQLIRSTTGDWIKHQLDSGGSRLGDTQAHHRFFWDSETQRVRIAQVYYKRVKTARVALLADGSVESDIEKVKALEAADKQLSEQNRMAGIPDGPPVVEFVRQPVTTVWMAHVLDQIELDHRECPLPFKALPLVPSKGFHFWRRPVGAVEYMKDPQREKNKRRSVITEIAGRAAHSGFFDKAGTGAGATQIENFASGAGVRIEYDQDIPIQIKPPELPQYLVYLEQQATEDIPRSVNVTPELAGQPKAQVVSGRAITARQQSGQLSQEYFMDSFAQEQAQVAKLITEVIKEKTTPEEARRVLGSLARRNQDDAKASEIAGMDPDALDKLLSRAFDVRYDVIVTTEPWDPSGKLAAARALSDLFQGSPPVPIPQVLLARDILVTEVAVESGSLPKSIGEKYLAVLKEAQASLQQPPPGAAPPPPAAGAAPPELAMLPQAGSA